MKLSSLGSLACLFLFFTPACNSTTPSVPSAAEATAGFDIGKLLGGIKDGPTATAAKGPLESAVAQLKNAIAGANASAPATGATDAAAGQAKAKSMLDGVMAKFGINPSTLGTITNLLQNPAVSSVIGPVLTQLKGLLPAM